jgi:hypothetical protein
MTVIRKTFPSATALYDAVPEADEIAKSWGHSARWIGATKAERKARKFNWPEAVDAMAKLPELTAPHSRGETVKRWNWDDGDDMCPDRFREGRPWMRKRVRTNKADKRGKFRRVIINLSESSSVKADAMKWKTFAAARIVDELERQGIRCEVVAYFHSRGCTRDGETLEVETVLKPAHAPLNLGLIATCASPWFMRCWILGLMVKTFGARTSGGMGTPRSYREVYPTTKPDELVIDRGQCLNVSSAKAFVKKLDLS